MMDLIDTFLLSTHWLLLIVNIVVCWALWQKIIVTKAPKEHTFMLIGSNFDTIFLIFMVAYSIFEVLFIFNYLELYRFPIYEILSIIDQIILSGYFIFKFIKEGK